MSESKHTPGPWGLWIDGNGYPVTGPSAAAAWSAENGVKECPICKDIPIVLISSIGGRQPAIAFGDSAEETEANARLIAAAPELLEALQGLLADEGVDFIRSRLWDAARAAIAKATVT